MSSESGADIITKKANASTPASDDSEVPSRWRSSRHALGGIALPMCATGILILVWQGAVAIFDIPLYILPAPSQFAGVVASEHSRLLTATLITGQESVYGFLLAVAISIPLALLFASSAILRKMFYPIVVFFQVIPKIAITPIFIVWFGVGLKSIVILTFTLCFFPILVNALSGFLLLDPRLLDMTKTMAATRWQAFKYLRLQAALPFIFSGLRVGIVFATVGAIVGEFVGSNGGLGYVLQNATGLLDSKLAFAALVYLSGLGLVLNYVVVGIEWLSMPWQRSDR